MGVFHTMFRVSDQCRGSPTASLRPSPVGPRQSGQLPLSLALVVWTDNSIIAATRNKTVLSLVLLNFTFEFLTKAPNPRGIRRLVILDLQFVLFFFPIV